MFDTGDNAVEGLVATKIPSGTAVKHFVCTPLTELIAPILNNGCDFTRSAVSSNIDRLSSPEDKHRYGIELPISFQRKTPCAQL